MSDLMLYGVLRMPYEMAMNDELSRFQFYQRAQQALDRISELEKDLHMIQRHYDQSNTHPVKEPTEDEIEERFKNCINGDEVEAMLRQQALEIQALHQILEYEGIEVGKEYLDECVADLRKAQEK